MTKKQLEDTFFEEVQDHPLRHFQPQRFQEAADETQKVKQACVPDSQLFYSSHK